MQDVKLINFTSQGRDRPVKFAETIQVKDGVTCDVYAFVGDDTQDLAIVRVTKGHKTPLQKVLLGDKTIEGYLDGKGKLMVRSSEGNTKVYSFDDGKVAEKEVFVQIGEIMQWTAADNADLLFYEICEPSYKDGRYENLEE